MSNPSIIAIIAPLIAAFAALIGIAINVISTRITRREDRDEKYREWKRSKQVSDVEIIVPKLDSFLTELAECVEEIEVLQVFTTEDIRTVVSAKEQNYDTDARVVSSLLAYREKYDAFSKKLWNLDPSRRAWFNFSARRLSMWFDDSGEVAQELTSLGQQFQKFHTDLARYSDPLKFLIDRLSVNGQELVDPRLNIERRHQVEAEGYMPFFIKALEQWPALNTSVLQCQAMLIERCKPQVPIDESCSNDGLLVKIARWTEKRLRKGIRF